MCINIFGTLPLRGLNKRPWDPARVLFVMVEWLAAVHCVTLNHAARKETDFEHFRKLCIKMVELRSTSPVEPGGRYTRTPSSTAAAEQRQDDDGQKKTRRETKTHTHTHASRV